MPRVVQSGEPGAENIGEDHGPKGRGYKTNAELEFHTDSCDVTGRFALQGNGVSFKEYLFAVGYDDWERVESRSGGERSG